MSYPLLLCKSGQGTIIFGQKRKSGPLRSELPFSGLDLLTRILDLCPSTSGFPRGPAPTPLAPRLFSKSCSFQEFFREKPLFGVYKLWAQGPLGVKTSADPPLTKILDPAFSITQSSPCLRQRKQTICQLFDFIENITICTCVGALYRIYNVILKHLKPFQTNKATTQTVNLIKARFKYSNQL